VALAFAAGALVISDSVTLDVQPLADLAVTLYLPGAIPPGFQITGRYARQTNYLSPPGNFAAAITMPVGKITDEESSAVAELEEFLGKGIRFQADEQYAQEQFDVVLL